MRATILAIGLAAGNYSYAQSIDLVQLVSGLTNPVDVDHAGDQRLFVAQRAGLVLMVNSDGSVSSTPFLDIVDRVNSTSGEQGLLGLTFDPQYSINGYFYVNYVHGAGNGVTRISRFSVSADPNVADPASELIIWSTPQPGTNHNGGDLAFGPDGYLWIPLGDGSLDINSQDMTSPHGKILRIDVHSGSPYSIPPDNPFAGSDPSVVLPEIWASGLRNPFRFSFDEMTGNVWIGDVGQSAYEEIDLWSASDHSAPNFGWRCYEGPAPYNTSDCAPPSSYVSPIHAHPHTDGSCSLIGGYVYRGSASPDLYGKYIYTDFCHGRIHSLTPNGSGGWIEAQHTASNGMGFASFGLDLNGELLVVNTMNGTIDRLMSSSSSPQVAVDVKVFLEGPFNEGTNLMNDQLRALAGFPLTEPYSGMGAPQLAGGGGEQTTSDVLDVTGNNAIVDWVRLVLRSSTSPDQLIATRQALLQRDGDIVMADGLSPVVFNVSPGDYYLSIDHRNHLAVMTASPIALSTNPVVVDLRLPSIPAYGTNARKTIGSWAALWAGDITGDGQLKYTGEENDRDRILAAIGGAVPTATVSGYLLEDVDLNGIVRYTGGTNDSDRILSNIGGVVPTTVRQQQIP